MQTVNSSINIEKRSGGSVTDLKITIPIFILMNVLMYSILLLIFVLKLCITQRAIFISNYSKQTDLLSVSQPVLLFARIIIS